MGDLFRYAETWGEQLSSEYGITKVRRKANLQAFPKFGWILKLAGMGKDAEYDDPILSAPPKHINFVAGWYGNQGR